MSEAEAARHTGEGLKRSRGRGYGVMDFRQTRTIQSAKVVKELPQGGTSQVRGWSERAAGGN